MCACVGWMEAKTAWGLFHPDKNDFFTQKGVTRVSQKRHNSMLTETKPALSFADLFSDCFSCHLWKSHIEVGSENQASSGENIVHAIIHRFLPMNNEPDDKRGSSVIKAKLLTD